MAEQREIHLLSSKVIVVAGKVGSGKSTVLNNLYGLNLFTKSSPRPVTTAISKHHIEKEGKTFVVLDTPGLGSIFRSTESIIAEVANFVKGKDFILLYCLPVKPSDTLTESDINTVKTIDSLLGRRVWDKCVLLLTFSDVAVQEFGSDMKAYTAYLQSHADAFYDQFRECGIILPPITMVSNDETLRYNIPHESTGQIIAVPVNDVQHGLDWINSAVQVIIYTSRLTKRKEPDTLRDIVCRNPIPRGIGMLVGAAIGAFFGSFIGLVGRVIGAFIGAVFGIMLAIAGILATNNLKKKLVIAVKEGQHDQDYIGRAVQVITDAWRRIHLEFGKWYDIVRQNPILNIIGTLVVAGLGAFFEYYIWGSIIIGAFIGAAFAIGIMIIDVFIGAAFGIGSMIIGAFIGAAFIIGSMIIGALIGVAFGTGGMIIGALIGAAFGIGSMIIGAFMGVAFGIGSVKIGALIGAAFGIMVAIASILASKDRKKKASCQ